MKKHTVVALAVFAALVATQAFAQDLVISSAVVPAGTAGLLSSTIDPSRDRVEIGVENHGRLRYDQCLVTVKYFGDDVISWLRDGNALVTRTFPVSFHAGDKSTSVTADMLWTAFANQAGLKGHAPAVYFNAKIVVPYEAGSTFQFSTAP